MVSIGGLRMYMRGTGDSDGKALDVLILRRRDKTATLKLLRKLANKQRFAPVMPDGFLRTGDISTIDANGFVRIVDRKKDMINVSGLKVYPNEVEEIVSMHPGMLEAGARRRPKCFFGRGGEDRRRETRPNPDCR